MNINSHFLSHTRTKVIATVGPASSSEAMLKKIIASGVNVIRLNFSHGTHETHKRTIRTIKKISHPKKQPVALLQDVPGPRLRIGVFQEGQVRLKTGKFFTLTTKKMLGNEEKVWVNHRSLPRDVKPGHIIYLRDGSVQLKVTRTTTNEVRCRVIRGDVLMSASGMNVPQARLSFPLVQRSDLRHIEFGVAQGVDMIALSFVRSHKEIVYLKKWLKKRGYEPFIIAKIENRQALDDLEAIIEVSDGIMVARGDLGVNMNLEEVPVLQKDIIRRCNAQGKPVITATQMLESMIVHPTPTRAEVADIANAILDGTDAVMLSGETAIGAFPAEAVDMMTRIIRATEKHLETFDKGDENASSLKPSIADEISSTAGLIAYNVCARLIIAPTRSGITARLVSKYRPCVPVIAIVHSLRVQQQLLLSWGVYPLFVKEVKNLDLLISRLIAQLKAAKIVRRHDVVVITGGSSRTIQGATNDLRVETIP